MAVTLKEIAQDLGVSVVTVSKVLRNNEDISKKTRERVLLRAKELGYRPNLTARSLVTGRSSLVGLLVPDLLHPYFAEIARSLAAALRRQGIYLVICSSEGDPELERHQVEHLLGRQLDAMVVASVGHDEATLRAVVQAGMPLILIDRKLELAQAHFIGSNDTMIGEVATEHLLAMGCERIAHLRGPENSVGEKRLLGYRRALRKAGVPYRRELVSSVSSGDVESKAQGALFADEMLRLPQRPDAMFCHSDPMAIGAMQSVLAAGMRVPDEIAIIGCGNLHYDDALRIPLSSVNQKSGLIGERAAQLIIEKTCKGKYDEADTSDEICLNIRLRPELVVRESTLRVTRPAEHSSSSKVEGKSERGRHRGKLRREKLQGR